MKIFVCDHNSSKKKIKFCQENNIGLLYTPKYNQVPRSDCFIVDNGAFEAWQKNTPWDAEAFLKYIDKIVSLDKIPYFVVLPDIVAGGVSSLKQSAEYYPCIPKAWPKYLAVQNGMEVPDIKKWVDEWEPDGLFVGGTVSWKWRNTHILARYAHKWGIKCHVGRIGSWEGYEMCHQCRVDSVDGSNPIRHDKLDMIPAWIEDQPKQKRIVSFSV